MVKIPSYLKGLVDTRARADAYVQRLEAVLQEVEERLAKARADRDAADTLIRAFNPALDPSVIEPVRAWRGKYGNRGEKVAALRDFVQSAYPSAVSTAEAAWHLSLKFEMDFISSEARDAWKKTAVRNPLRLMAARGEIERLDVDGHDGRERSSWRWVPRSAELRRDTAR